MLKSDEVVEDRFAEFQDRGWCREETRRQENRDNAEKFQLKLPSRCNGRRLKGDAASNGKNSDRRTPKSRRDAEKEHW